MNGEELQKLSEFVVSHQIPVYTIPRNQLMLLRNHPAPVVINTNTADQFCSDKNVTGLHWTTFWVCTQKAGLGVTRRVAHFYDSFGNECTKYGITSPWPVVKYIPFATQPPESDLCGHFVLFFNSKRATGLGFDRVCELFDQSNLQKNDDRVKRHYQWVKAISNLRPQFNSSWCPRLACIKKQDALKLYP